MNIADQFEKLVIGQAAASIAAQDELIRLFLGDALSKELLAALEGKNSAEKMRAMAEHAVLITMPNEAGVQPGGERHLMYTVWCQKPHEPIDRPRGYVLRAYMHDLKFVTEITKEPE